MENAAPKTYDNTDLIPVLEAIAASPVAELGGAMPISQMEEEWPDAAKTRQRLYIAKLARKVNVIGGSYLVLTPAGQALVDQAQAAAVAQAVAEEPAPQE